MELVAKPKRLWGKKKNIIWAGSQREKKDVVKTIRQG